MTRNRQKSSHSHIKDDLALNNHLGILQPPSSSKLYVLLSRNLMEDFWEHGDSEIAKIIPFAYQRLPSTKQPFWISSNIIIFQTIYPLEQKLDGRQQTDRLHRKAEIIPLRCQRGPSNKQPSRNSSNYTFQTICHLQQKLDDRRQAKYIQNGLNRSFEISKKGIR